jgi:hypothetical protein
LSQSAAPSGLLSRALQTGANIATIIVACLLSVVLVKTYLMPGPVLRRPGASAIESISVGKSLSSQLPGVNWSSNGETVLLALSTHCHFCSESAPFFRQLSEKSGKTFKIVAVLPEPASEARDYLNREGVHVDQLRQLSLDRIGVDGTPTMLLLNSRGIVTKSWVGKLGSDEQNQAIKAIVGGRAVASRNNPSTGVLGNS